MIKIKVVEVPDDAGETMKMAEMGDGFIQPYFDQDAESLQRISDHLLGMTIRPDDVLLATYSKTGTQGCMFNAVLCGYTFICKYKYANVMLRSPECNKRS